MKFLSNGKLFLWLCLCISCLTRPAYAKDPNRIVVAGIQIKPIFPVNFLHTGTQSSFDQGIQYDITLKSGFNGGMVIRKGLTDLLSLETGINYVKRKYALDIRDSGYSESSSYQIIGYEIPVSLLVYIRLGEIMFMNASMGASPDMFASNVLSRGENHTSVTVARHVFQPAILANLGWEARTNKSGFFYLGASLHRPFNDLFVTKINYRRNGIDSQTGQYVSGSYLTFDVRYFFPENKTKKNDETSDR